MIGDTTEDKEARQHQIFKRMGGEEKVLQAMAFSDFVRDLALAGLSSRNPKASESLLSGVGSGQVFVVYEKAFLEIAIWSFKMVFLGV